MSQPPALAEMAPVALPARKRSGARVALRAAAPKPTEHEISSDQAQVVPFEAPSSAETPEAAPEESTTPIDQEASPSTEPEKEAMEPVAEPSEPVDQSTQTSSLNPMAKDTPSENYAPYRPAAQQGTQPGNQQGANEAPAAPAAPVSTRTLLKEAEEKLSLLRDNREIFEWILEKQSSLRTEFVGFLKKDLREIDYVVSDINDQGSKDEFAANALELIKDTYIKHWERSFELISPDDLLKKPGEQK
ncbi:MAG TPA: hypothetical protein PLV33_04620 [Opitutaceae bacterium]|nr:hypothetical protein [Opitutaceae bacterium]HOR24868.1 hypothetical protein [Opitutaceae bacterium]HPK49166.1 hypothetical protein [Opitutaceae bacterium]